MAKKQYTAGFRTRPAAPRSQKLLNSSASAAAGAPSAVAAAPQESLFDIVYENDLAVLKVKDKYAGLFTTGFLSARGKDSSGSAGGGTDLESVWTSLSTATDAFKDVLIDGAHIPSLGIGKIAGLQAALDGKLGTDDLSTAQWAAINSGVTDVMLSGLRTSVSTLESGLAAETARAKAKEDAIAADLTAETDRAKAAEAALSGITDTLSAKLNGIESGAQVNVIESVKLNGTALAVSGKAVNVNAATSIGVPTGLSAGALTSGGKITLSLSSGYTIPKESRLSDIEKITALFALDSDGNVYVTGNRGFYSNAFVSARGKDSSGGTGGGGSSLEDVWASLTGNTDAYKDSKINLGHIPAIGMDKVTGLSAALLGKADRGTTLAAYGIGDAYTDDETDVLLSGKSDTGHKHAAGDITSGTLALDRIPTIPYAKTSGVQAALVSGTSIKTINGVSLLGSGDIVTPNTTYSSKAAASGGTDLSLVTTGEKYIWNAKQAAISDLATIRSNATDGATAYGWGDHSKAGYLKRIANLTINGTLYDGTNEVTINTPTYTLSSFGITASATELNYTKGVTSAIQTQLNAKANSSALANYLPLAGGTMTGNITFPNNKGLVANTNTTSNWIEPIIFLKGGVASGKTHEAGIGWHNTGGSKGTGTITLVPYAQDTEPWYRTVGLSITEDQLLFNGSSVSLNGHTHTFASLTSKPTTLAGYGITDAMKAYGATGAVDLNTLTTNGTYYINGTATNTPRSFSEMLCMKNNDTVAQLAIAYTSTGGLYYRGGLVASSGNTWYDWRTVLDSSNYNTYVPTLTGQGATGSWNINVLGTAKALAVNNHTFTQCPTIGDLKASLISNMASGGDVNYPGQSYNFQGSNAVSLKNNWANDTYTITDGSRTSFLRLDRYMYGSYGAFLMSGMSANEAYGGLARLLLYNGEWYGPYNILDSGNYKEYVPTLTGQGASGTWGINISGNAATTTKLATARTIALSGGAVSTPTAFDGSGNISLPVTSLSADYVEWGNSNRESDMGPIFSGLCDPLRGNRFAGIPGEDVEIEYSNDAVNYYDYGATDAQKSSFFTQFGGYLICGKNTNTTTANNNHRLRVTVTANHVYTRLDKAIIYVSTLSTTNCWVKVTLSNDSTFPNNSSTLVLGTYGISGWSGYDAIPLRGCIVDPNARGGSYFRYWRFEFGGNFAGNSSGYKGLTVMGIEAYGGYGWTLPNTMAKYGRPYTYDWQGNAKFMGGITASYFSGEASSASKLTTVRNIWGQSFDGSGNVDGTLHLKASGNSYTQGIRIYQNGTGYAGILLGSNGLTATTGTDSNSWFISTNSSKNFSISKGGYSTDTTVAFGHDGGNWWLKGGNVRMPGNALYLGNSNLCTIYVERPSNNYIWANQAGGTLYLGTAAGGSTTPETAGIGIVGKQVCVGGTTLRYGTLNVKSSISIVGSTNPLIDFRNSSNATIGYLQAVDAGWMGLGPGSGKGIFVGKDGALTINSTPPTTPTGNSIDAPGAIHSTTGLYSEGFVSARGVDSSSDERLKTDIKPLENALQYVLGTKYRSFRWKEDGKPCIGVIAQEELGREHGYLVEKHKEYYSYNYAATTALIGAALQEEDRKVEALKARIAALEAEVERLRNNMYNS